MEENKTCWEKGEDHFGGFLSHLTFGYHLYLQVSFSDR